MIYANMIMPSLVDTDIQTSLVQ